jgi:reactive intermediate/imine deaminase
MTRYITSSRAAPAPRTARYSHAVEHAGTLYVTGQLPIDPEHPDAPLPATIEAQTELVFVNLRLIAEDAGCALTDTLFARIYLLDFQRDYVGFNSVFHRHFDDAAAMPGRTTVGVAQLGRGALVEVDLVVACRR